MLMRFKYANEIGELTIVSNLSFRFMTQLIGCDAFYRFRRSKGNAQNTHVKHIVLLGGVRTGATTRAIFDAK